MPFRTVIPVCATALLPLLGSFYQGQAPGDCVLPVPPAPGVVICPTPQNGWLAGAGSSLLWPRTTPALQDTAFQLGFARLQLAEQELAQADTPAKARAALARIGRVHDRVMHTDLDGDRVNRPLLGFEQPENPSLELAGDRRCHLPSSTPSPANARQQEAIRFRNRG